MSPSLPVFKPGYLCLHKSYLEKFWKKLNLGLDFRLPNGAEVKYFVVDDFDIFFLNRPLNRWAREYDDDKMWSGNGTTVGDIKYKIINPFLTFPLISTNISKLDKFVLAYSILFVFI